MKSILLDNNSTFLYVNHFVSKGLSGIYLPKKRKLLYTSDVLNSPISIRLALNLTYQENTKKLAVQEFNNQVFLMIRSGMACCGLFENGELADHKVFRAYMVRKKQGMSQIKHLKTKGKSRAGSRVRLAETLEFFEEINNRLEDYFQSYRVDQIGLSYATTLIPYLFGSKVPTPFEKNDPRIFTIPKHIPSPTFEALKSTFGFMSKNELIWEDESDWLLEPLNKPNQSLLESKNLDDNW